MFLHRVSSKTLFQSWVKLVNNLNFVDQQIVKYNYTWGGIYIQ